MQGALGLLAIWGAYTALGSPAIVEGLALTAAPRRRFVVFGLDSGTYSSSVAMMTVGPD